MRDDVLAQAVRGADVHALLHRAAVDIPYRGTVRGDPHMTTWQQIAHPGPHATLIYGRRIDLGPWRSGWINLGVVADGDYRGPGANGPTGLLPRLDLLPRD